MMFNKSKALLSALLITTTVTAADLRTKSTNEEITNVIHSKDEIDAVSASKVSCDYKDAYSGLEAACDSAGGQLFQFSVTMKADGISVSYKNMASRIGASCDTDAALKAQEEAFSFFSLIGFEVTVEESGASTLSAAVVAFIALTGAVATLI